MKTRVACVYFLRCPRTLAVKYIGVSLRPAQRLREHLKGMCFATRDWIASLAEPPIMDIIFQGLERSKAENVESRLQMFHEAMNRDFLPAPHLYNCRPSGKSKKRKKFFCP